MSDQLDTRARVSCRDTEEYEHLVAVTRAVYNDDVPFDELPTVEQHLLKRVEMTIGKADFDEWAQRFVIDYGAEMGDIEPPPPERVDQKHFKAEPPSVYNLQSAMLDLTKINEAQPVPALFEMKGKGGEVQSFMPRGYLCLLASEGGVGKSLLTLHLGLSLVLNRPTSLKSATTFGNLLKPVPRTGKVALLYGEEDINTCSIRIKQQLQPLRRKDGSYPPTKFTDGYGRVRQEVLEYLSGRLIPVPLRALATDVDSTLDLSGSTHDQTLEAADVRFDKLLSMLTDIDNATKDKGDGFDLIVVDPLAQFGGGNFEVDNGEAARLMKRLDTLTQFNGNPSVLLVHHSPKGSKRASGRFRGSSAIKDHSRWGALLERVGATDKNEGLDFLKDREGRTVLELKIAKTNYGPSGRVRCIQHQAQLLPIEMKTDGHLLTATEPIPDHKKALEAFEKELETSSSTAEPTQWKDPNTRGVP